MADKGNECIYTHTITPVTLKLSTYKAILNSVSFIR